MVVLIFCIYGALLFAIQTSLLNGIAVSGVTPDLVLIAAVYCAMMLPADRGRWVGCGLGIVQDCLSGSILGVNTLSKGLITHTFTSLKNKIMVEGVVPVSVFLLAASIFDGLIFYVTTRMLFKTPPVEGFLFTELPLYAVYNALVGPVVFYLLNRNRDWWMRKLQLTRPDTL